jgi:SAM-dependent methyltransferase
MDPQYAKDYRELYEKHWWWRAREDLILSTLERLRPGGGWGPILDIGCGDGLFFGELSKRGDVSGIEMDPTGVTPGGPWSDRIAIRPFDETFQPGKLFSLVLLLDVLEHFPDPKPMLERAIALLAPGGTLLITVPAFRSLWTSHDVLNRHYTRYTRRELVALVREAGGEVRRARYFYQWMAPLKLAAYLKESLLPATPASPRVPPAWLNQLLYSASRLEHRIAAALDPPFGSSLLLEAAPGKPEPHTLSRT